MPLKSLYHGLSKLLKEKKREGKKRLKLLKVREKEKKSRVKSINLKIRLFHSLSCEGVYFPIY